MTTDSVQDRRNYVRAVKSTAFHQAGLACAREMLILSSCKRGLHLVKPVLPDRQEQARLVHMWAGSRVRNPAVRGLPHC